MWNPPSYPESVGLVRSSRNHMGGTGRNARGPHAGCLVWSLQMTEHDVSSWSSSIRAAGSHVSVQIRSLLTSVGFGRMHPWKRKRLQRFIAFVKKKISLQKRGEDFSNLKWVWTVHLSWRHVDSLMSWFIADDVRRSRAVEVDPAEKGRSHLLVKR